MRKKAEISALIIQQHPHSAVNEAYRILRTNLSFASIDQKCRLLLVTSNAQNDGKSTISANLAIVLAQAGEKVLLVDCDLRKPNVQRIFNLDNQRGFTNALMLGCDPIEMAQKGPVDGLTVLTSGTLPPNPSELLGSERVRSLWPQLLGRFDYVIIDSPPVLAVNDAVLLATQVEGVILVVCSGVDRVDIVNEAKEQLLKANARILGVVLDKVKMTNHG
jgi:protein-tyrosine kinase